MADGNGFGLSFGCDLHQFWEKTGKKRWIVWHFRPRNSSLGPLATSPFERSTQSFESQYYTLFFVFLFLTYVTQNMHRFSSDEFGRCRVRRKRTR